jgi:hypothetical protein
MAGFEKISIIIISEALDFTDGNRSQAAKLLGLSRITLHSKIKSCNDFMKRGFAAQFSERFTRRLFGWLKFLSPQQATGYFGIFTTAHRAVVSHFRFK